MANPEHVKILKQSRDAIAHWKDLHPGEAHDLNDPMPRGADLRGMDLSGANLSGSYLRGANLIGADLNGADLSGSHLRDAHLTGADLRNANLGGATLAFAELGYADLRGANLTTANLTRAQLSGANLEGAMCAYTSFGDVDLSQVNGLETVEHRRPSSIGVDTLIRSNGRIPRPFLDGAGVPEELIDYLPSLLGAMEPIQFYSCFISYSTKDDGDGFAHRLHSRLRDQRLSVWFAPEDLAGGQYVESQIDQAIRVKDRLLLVLSEASMGSAWVRREIKKARAREIAEQKNVLFPLGLVPYSRIRDWECLDSDTGEDLAEQVRRYHIPDFSDWKDHDAFETAFASLMDDLRLEPEKGT